MHIVLFGATGKIGNLVLNLLCSYDYSNFFTNPTITVVVRRKDKLKVGVFNHLNVVEGDALNLKLIEKILSQNVSVLVSCLGHKKNSAISLQTIFFKKVLDLCGIDNRIKIISLTGSGVFVRGDNVSLLDKLFLAPIKIMDKHRVIDGQEHVDLLFNRYNNFVVVRTPIHVNFGKYYTIKDNLDKTLHLFANRIHIANFIKDLAVNEELFNRYRSKAPVISSYFFKFFKR